MLNVASEYVAIANEWRAQAARSTTAQLQQLVSGRIRLKQAGGWLAVSIAKDELAKRAAVAIPAPTVRTVKEITDYRLSQLGICRPFWRDARKWTIEQIDDFRTTVACDQWADVALVGWGAPDQHSLRRQREVARYHVAEWRTLLNNYLALKEQLKQAKQIQSATPAPGPSWSAWSRYVKGLKSSRASVVNRLTRQVAKAKQALREPIKVWKRRPLNSPKPKYVPAPEYRRAA